MFVFQQEKKPLLEEDYQVVLYFPFQNILKIIKKLLKKKMELKEFKTTIELQVKINFQSKKKFNYMDLIILTQI